MRKLLLLLLILCCVSCKPKPKVLWSFETGGFVYASPAIWKNLLIIGSIDAFLYALDLQSGKLVWKTKLNERVYSKPLIDSDLIYIGGKDFYCIEPATGKIRWQFPTSDLICYEACSDESALYFGGQNATFYKITKDGNKIWEHKTQLKFEAKCALYKNLVITSSWDGHFYGFDRSSGELIWKVPTNIHNFGPPELVGDEVYFASHEYLYRLETATGKVLSKTKTSYLNGVVYYQNFLWTNEEGLTKRTLDGNPIATVKFNVDSHFHPFVADGYFILSDGGNSLYAVSTDLKILWKYKGKGTFWAPGVLRDRVYYTGNRDSHVYALQLPE